MYKFMSGYKNLLHFARMHKNVTKERIQEVIQQVGLENRIHEKVSTYSLGMRQRLGLAQALLHRPKFLILDEPTNGLGYPATASVLPYTAWPADMIDKLSGNYAIAHGGYEYDGQLLSALDHVANLAPET